MQKTALTIFGALLISGLAVQMAAASPHHHRGKVHLSHFRGAYNQVSGPTGVGPIQPAFQPAFQPAPFNDDWDYVIGKLLDSHSGD
jgi:hypothetical protein